MAEPLRGAPRRTPVHLAVIVAPWRDLLVEHDTPNCPLTATVIDASDNDQLRTHVNELLAQWQASVTACT